jgi:hypothetical protein
VAWDFPVFDEEEAVCSWDVLMVIVVAHAAWPDAVALTGRLATECVDWQRERGRIDNVCPRDPE